MTQKLFYLLLLPALIFASCKKDDTSTLSVNDRITNGTWRVTYYAENGSVKTANYSGYAFTFVTGGLLTATKNGANVSGSWATGTDNSKVKLMLKFLSPPLFIEISEDWQVLESTATTIRMEHVSGGNGGTDNLTFEKN